MCVFPNLLYSFFLKIELLSFFKLKLKKSYDFNFLLGAVSLKLFIISFVLLNILNPRGYGLSKFIIFWIF